MIKRSFFYVLLPLFFAINSLVYGAVQKPDLQQQGSVPTTTTTTTSAASATTTTSAALTTSASATVPCAARVIEKMAQTLCSKSCDTKSKTSLESLFKEIESILDVEQLKKLLNLLYLKKELLTFLIADRIAVKQGLDFDVFSKFECEIITNIGRLENDSSPKILQILENLDEFLISSGSAFCFLNLMLFFDLRDAFCKLYFEISKHAEKLLTMVRVTQKTSPQNNLGGLVKFCKEIEFDYPKYDSSGSDFCYIDTAACSPQVVFVLEKYFAFFANLDLNTLKSNSANAAALISVTSDLKEKLDKLSKLFPLSIQFNKVFERDLICSSSRPCMFEKIYNMIYEKIYMICSNDGAPKITAGPDKGRDLPSILFEKIDNVEQLRAKINELAVIIEYSDPIRRLEKRVTQFSRIDTCKELARSNDSLIRYAYSNRMAFQKINGCLRNLADDLFVYYDSYLEQTGSTFAKDSWMGQYYNDINRPIIYLPQITLIPYLFFLQQKYQEELKVLEKKQRSAKKVAPRRPGKKKGKKDKKTEAVQEVEEAETAKECEEQAEPVDACSTTCTVEDQSLADQSLNKNRDSAKQKKAKQKKAKQAKNVKAEPAVSTKTAVAPEVENLQTVAESVDRNLYFDEKVIKETDQYKIIVKSWGCLPSQGYTLILYKNKSKNKDEEINLKDYGYKNLDQVKFDKFHFIPNSLNISNGTVISCGGEGLFNQNVKSTQKINLSAKIFAVCVKAIMLPKFAFRYFELKSDAQIMELLNWPSGKGFRKGAFVFLFDQVEKICFHRCFHKFAGDCQF